MSKPFPLNRFAEKLAALRYADPAFKLYGASGHRYQLNRRLKEQAILEFEQRIRVAIPDEYRSYLLEFADGGAGPDNGVLPLDLRWNNVREPLDVPFPISAAIAQECTSRPSKERFLEGYEELGGEMPGTMQISDAGCGIFSFLVFSGEQRGFIWYSGGNFELYPSAGGDKQLGFFDWYEEWLDTSLIQLQKSAFVIC